MIKFIIVHLGTRPVIGLAHISDWASCEDHISDPVLTVTNTCSTPARFILADDFRGF